MSNFRPWIRRYNYIEDYFYSVYEYYIRNYPSFPISYYSFDFENSIYDEKYLLGGSYEKLGVGELSGIKWKKILAVPVFGTQQVSPTQDSGENGGMNSQDSMMTSILIPQVYGIKPVESDFIDLNFGFKTSNNDYNKALYVVTNVNLAHHGDYLNLYYLSLQVAPLLKPDLENQISSYWSFYEPTKEILRLSNVNLLNKITTRGEGVCENLKNIFDKKINFYLESVEI